MSIAWDKTPWNAGPDELPGDLPLDTPPDDEPELGQCDCCGKMVPVDDIGFIPFDALGNSAGCDTFACPKCRGDDEPQ